MSRPEVLQVYIARHGEIDWDYENKILGRSNGIPLNANGHAQAADLGRGYVTAGIEPDIAYSSPAARAIQTTQGALSAMGCSLEPVIDNDLQEIDQGHVEGASRAEFYNELTLKRISKDPRGTRAPGGESVDDTLERMRRFLGRAVTDLREMGRDTAIVTSHGFAKRTLVGHFLGWSIEEIRGMPTPNCSVSLLEYDAGFMDTYNPDAWRVVYFAQRFQVVRSVI